MLQSAFGRIFCSVSTRIGPSNAVLLCQVLYYFDPPIKTAVVNQVLTNLRPGGLFSIGTAEGRVACKTTLQSTAPGAFRELAA